MAYVTLYSFYKPPAGPGTGTLYTVVRDDTDFTFIDFTTTSAVGGPTQPPEGTIISVVCSGTTKYTYKVKTNPSYATYETQINSIYCGYTPPVCDIIEKTFNKTDETEVGANDGTGNMFATSSKNPITYYLLHPLQIASNTVGLFTGLAPGDYAIKAVDNNDCSVIQNFTINAYDPSLTRCKYRVQFPAIIGGDIYRLDFLDQLHQYDPLVYPIYLPGTDSQIVSKQANVNEDKTEPIISRQLEINLIQNGIFEIDEFAQSPERTWFMKLYINDVLEFQGWLLPDQSNDKYADPIYDVQLIATDGLPSLKGSNFGDPSIFTYDVNMNKVYTQRYGLFKWAYLVKICLDWLNYDYGLTTIVSSLENNDTYDEQFWANISTWGDQYYDSSGNAVNVYDALSSLLRSLKLSIIQYKGQFILCDWNTLWYINKGLQLTDYEASFYQFNGDMSAIITTVTPEPSLLEIGATNALKPINPMQEINYDLSYGIMKATVNFQTFALLYENPSFEIGAVQGDLPPDFNHKNGSINAFLNYDPITDNIYQGAYDGDWEIKIQGSGIPSPINSFFENPSPYFPIDQANKLLEVSFQWKVPVCTDTNPAPMGYVFSFTVIFVDADGGIGYFLQDSPSKMVSYYDFLHNSKIPNPDDSPSQLRWIALDDTSDPTVYYTEGDAASIKGNPTTEYIAWQNYTVTTPPFPGSQIGTVSVRFYGVKKQLYDTTKYITPGHDSAKNFLFIDVDTTDTGYYLLDELNITVKDASQLSNLQTGEIHTVTNVTNFGKAEPKEIDLPLFTYPNNKRLAGQLMYGTPYESATTFTLLKFKLQTGALKGRLPMAVINSWARTYQRPMRIFQGDIRGNNVPFYAVYQIEGYPNSLFMPFSIENDFRNSTCKVVLVEFDDSDAQTIYNYKAVYEKSARNNS